MELKMNENLLREYIKEIVFEMKMSGHENNENHMNFHMESHRKSIGIFT